MDRQAAGAPEPECASRGARIHRRTCRRQPARGASGNPQARPAACRRQPRPRTDSRGGAQRRPLRHRQVASRAAGGRPGRCARLLEGLRGEGEAPPLILWALASEIRTLANLRTAVDQGQALAAALKAERVFDDRRRRAAQEAVSRLRSGQLKAALMQGARIDRMIKGWRPARSGTSSCCSCSSCDATHDGDGLRIALRGVLIADCPIARR